MDIVDTNTDNNYGADGGTVIFAASLNGQDSGLTSSARKIFYQTSNGGHTLTGFADQNLNGVYDPTIDTTAIFTINLNLDKSIAFARDTYTVQMLQNVDSATHIDFNSGGYNFVGGNNSWAEFIPVGETVANPIDNNSPDLLLTPAVNHLPASSINTNANSGGVGNGQSVGSVGNLPETFRVDFVTDLRGDPAGSPANYGNPANRDHVFDGHYTVDGSSADFTATSGSTINIAAFDDPDGNNIVGDGVKDTITGVVIRFGSSTSGFIDLTQPLLPSYVVGGHTFTITEITDGSINVSGVAGTTSIATFTANGYNSLEYTWVAGDTFKIGNFGAAALSTDPVDFSVPVQVVDGDGDTASGNLGITLTSPGGGPAPPVLDLDANNSNAGGSDYASTFTIGGSPIPIADTDVTITDPDSTTMASATISMIVNGGVPPNDTLSISGTLPGGITASAYNTATGVLTLTGVASIANYEAALHQVVFSTADTSSNADRIISATVSDGAHASNTAETFMHVVPPPNASVDIAANLLTEPDASSLVTIHFNAAVTGFDVNDLTASGGALSAFDPIAGDTYQAIFTANPDFDGTGNVTLTGAYTDLALNPGITGATDTVDINTLPSTLDATILTTGTSGLGQVVNLTFVDLQNPIFSYAGLYDLGSQGGAFQRDAGFDINPSKEYAVSLEATGDIPVPIGVLTVEGVTIHTNGTVTLQLDNDSSTLLTQTALTSIIQPNDPIPHQPETASVDGNGGSNTLSDPTITPGSGAGSAENTVNYLYGAGGSGNLVGADDTDVLNGGPGNEKLSAALETTS